MRFSDLVTTNSRQNPTSVRGELIHLSIIVIYLDRFHVVMSHDLNLKALGSKMARRDFPDSDTDKNASS